LHHFSSQLVSRYRRQLGGAGIKAYTSHDIGEVNAGKMGADENLSFLRFRLRAFNDAKYAGTPMPGDLDLPHR